jgi:hypothetical protein
VKKNQLQVTVGFHGNIGSRQYNFVSHDFRLPDCVPKISIFNKRLTRFFDKFCPRKNQQMMIFFRQTAAHFVLEKKKTFSTKGLRVCWFFLTNTYAGHYG